MRKLGLLIFLSFSSIYLFSQTTYNYNGSSQTFTAPSSGLYKFELYGAKGGDVTSYYQTTGGAGGYASGELNLVQGEVLYLYVGGKGADRLGNHPYGSCAYIAGGWNGGGANRSAGNATPGGGASDIRIGGTGLANRVIVAGGGGGGGWYYSRGGNGGGLSANNGTQGNGSGTGARGGTQSAGGAAGPTTGQCYKSAGSLGLGGDGSGYSAGGGGGGGGYYGGGGGGYGDGGGGGSSYIGGVQNGSVSSGGNNGNGRIVVTVLNPSPTITSQPSNQSQVCVDSPVTFSVTGQNITAYQWQVSSNSGVTFSNLSNGGNYSGVNTNNLNVTAAVSNNNYQFRCVVSNSSSSLNSNASILSLDNIAPTLITKPTAITIPSQAGITIDEFYVVDLNNGTLTGDNCGIVSYTFSKSTFTYADIPNSPFTIDVTATDASGNSTTEQAVVTVLDNIAPTAIAQNITVQLDANGNATITPEQINNNSTDNSGGTLTYALDQTTFDCNDLETVVPRDNYSLSFDGVDDYVSLDQATQYITSASFTIEFWMNGLAANNTGGFGGRQMFSLHDLSGANKIRLGLCGSCNGVVNLNDLSSGSIQIGDGNWHHIALVYDGANYNVYVDGALDFTQAGQISAYGNPNWLSSDKSSLGQEWDGGSTSDFYKGSLDEVRIWNVARSQAQIQASQSISLSGMENGLVAYYQFDDGISSTSLADATANGANGALINIDANTAWGASTGTPIALTSSIVQVTLNVTDASNNSSTATAFVTVVDNIAPTVNLNGSATVTLNQNDPYTETATAEDNCSATLAITGTVDTATAGTYTLTYTATDGSGNVSAQVTRTVNVLDITDPVLNVSNITVNNDTGVCGAGIASFGASATDNSGAVNITYSIAEGSVFNVGTTQVTATATDASNNSVTATFNVIVIDAEAPIVNLNGSNTITLNQNDTYTETATAEDNCSATLAISGTVDMATAGSYTLTYTATDASGIVSAQLTRTINVLDVTAPTAIAQNITVQLDANGNATITPAQINNGSTDNSGGTLTYALDQTTFDCADLTTSVNDYALDFDGTDYVQIANNGQFDLNVMTVEAWVKPTTGNDGNNRSFISMRTSTGGGTRWSIHLNQAAGAIGVYDGSKGFTYLAVGTLSSNQWYHVALVMSNNGSDIYLNGVYKGHIVPGIFTAVTGRPLVIGDPNGPSTAYTNENFIGQIDEVRIWNGARSAAQIQSNKDVRLTGNEANLVAYYDMSDGPGQSILTDQSQNNNNGTLVSMNPASDWVNGALPSTTNAVPVTLTVTDAAGNSSTASATVTVEDNIAPSITINGAASVTHEAFTAYTDAGATTSDNCSATLATTNNVDVNTPGTYTVTYTSTDGSGNQTVATRTVVIADAIDPVLTVADINVNTDAGVCGAAITSFGASATDASGTPAITFNITEGTVFSVGTNQVTATATDASNNSVTATFNVNVTDNEAPLITLNGASSITIVRGETFNDPGATASDNCSATVNVTGSVNNTTLGTYTLTYQAVDPAGNLSTTVSRTVIVENIAPTFTSTPITSINDNQQYSYTITTQDADADAVSVTASNLPAWLTLAEAPTQVSTFAGLAGVIGSTDGTGGAARFTRPRDVALDGSGNVYVAGGDGNNIRKITPAGVVTTIAGSGTPAFADGTGTSASFYRPSGITVGGDGNVYVADSDNNRIRKITPAGVVTTIAGSGARAFANGTGTSASFAYPYDVAIDETGNLYVSDMINNRIRKITPAGVVTTLAGSGAAGATDGTGTAASFYSPYAIDIDGAGNLYVADRNNNRIRKITQAGVVTTLAGAGTFTAPAGVAVDASGNVYVGDTFGSKIKKITPEGEIITIAGTTYGNLDGPGDVAKFWNPNGIDVDSEGNVYVANDYQTTIRKVSVGGAILTGNPVGNAGTHTVTLDANDGNGGTAQQTFTITVNDVTAPTVLTQNITVELDANGNATIIASQIDNNSTDTEGITSLTLNVSAFTCANLGANTISLTATDAAGNSASANATVTVVDVISPTITLNGAASVTHEAYTAYSDAGATTTDNCSATLATTSNVDVNTPGTYAVTYTSTDASGNQTVATRTVVIADAIDPELTVADISVNNDTGVCGAGIASFGATATDNSGAVNIIYSIAEGSVFNVGTTQVTATATDASNNAVTATFNVTVADAEAPTVNLNGSNTITLNQNDSYNETATAEDNCSATLAISGTVDMATAGSYTLTYTATDASGNISAQVTRTIIVLDVTAPIAIAQDITVQLDANGNATITPAQINNGSSDNSGGTLTYALDQSNFDCSDLGSNGNKPNNSSLDFDGGNDIFVVSHSNSLVLNELTLAAWIHPDTPGGWQNILVKGSYGYGFAFSGGKLRFWNQGNGGATPVSTGSVPVGQWSHVAVTVGPSGTTFYINGQPAGYSSNTSFLQSNGNLHIGNQGTACYCNFFNGKLDEIQIWNSAKSEEEIQGLMNGLSGTESGLAAYYQFEDGTGSATLTDSSPNGNNGTANGIDVNSAWSTSVPTLTQQGIEVTLTVTDASGNSSTATANLTVEDNIAPSITMNGNASVTHEAYTAYTDAGATTTDNCSATLATTSNVDANTPGTYAVTYTSTDGSGNQTIATRTVLIADAVDPVLTVADINVNTDTGVCGATIQSFGASATDASGTPSINFDIAEGTVFAVGSTLVTATATDASNNSVTATFNVIVTDNEAPVIVMNGNASLTHEAYTAYSDAGATTTDNCSATLATTSNVDVNTPGTYSVTYTSTDASGNQTVATRTVVIADAIDPVLTVADINVNNDTGVCGATIQSFGASATDASGTPAISFNITEGTVFAVGTTQVTATATDASNNSVTATFNVNVTDNEAPVITMNGSATVQHDAFTAYTDAGATTSDNCSATLATTDNVNVNVSGTYAVTYTSTDASGNVTVETRTVNVRDVTVPNAIAQDITVSLDANGNASITPQDIDNGSSDDSGSVTLSLDQTTFDCADLDNGPAQNLALDFDHTNDYVTMGDVPMLNLDPRNAMTWEAYIKADATSTGYNAIFSKAITGGNYAGYMFTLENGKLMANMLNSLSSDHFYAIANDVDLRDDTWHHVAISFDGTLTASGVKMYIDGVLQTTSIGLNTLSATPIVTNASFNIGNRYDDTASGLLFKGSLDEVRIWNTTRTQAEIQSAMNTSLIGSEVGLIAYYDFEDGTGSATLTDKTSNGNHGTLTNMDPASDWVNGVSGLSQGGGNEVTLTVTDPSGNVSTATANVTVIDEIVPVITAPADISVFATSASGAVVNYTTPVGTDNCSVTTALTAGLANGATFPIGITVVTYIATDGSGNTASASFNVEVSGLAPEIIVPANITVSTDAGVCGAVVNYAATETQGIPSATITYDIQPGTLFAVGTTTVTATATNAVGTSVKTFTVRVNDTEAPVITLNGSATVQHDAFTAYTDAGATTSDNCSATLATTDNVNVNVSGSYTVTYTATDVSGNETVATRTVVVRDVTVPTAIAQDITVQLDANGNASITAQDIDNGSSDDSGNVTLSIDDADFDCNDLGGQALDFDGINGIVLSTSNLGITGAAPRTSETWFKTDNLAKAGIFLNIGNTSGSHSDFSLYQNGNTLWIWTVGSGNFNTGYTIDNDWHHYAAVYDGTTIYVYVDGVATPNPSKTFALNTGDAPLQLGGYQVTTCCKPDGKLDEVRIWNLARSQADIQNNMNSSLTGDETGLLVYYTFDDGAGNSLITDNSSNGNDGVLGAGMDPTTALVDSDRIGASGGNKVTLTVTDPSGNTSTATANVTVIDEILPVITAPADISVFATSAAGAVVNYTTPVGTDNCSVTTALTVGLANGATFPIGTTVVTYTATDGSGNTASTSFNVEVAGLAPEIIVPANITVSTDTGVCGAVVNYAATETQGIPSATITYDIQPGTLFAVGTTTVTATATNAVGTSVKTFTVRVNDTEAPVITLNGSATVQHDAFTAYTDAGATTSDNCSANLATTDNVNVNVSGTYTVTYTSTDASGNVTVATRSVNVQDVTLPTAIAQDITVQLDANGNASITADDIDNGSTDDSGNVTLSIDNSTFDCDDLGTDPNDFALSFDGVNDYITGSDAGLPMGNAARTLEVWIKTTLQGRTEIAFDYGTEAPVGKSTIGVHSSGGAFFWGAWGDFISATKVNDGVWHHIAFTNNGTTGSLYVDGNLESNRPFTLNTVLTGSMFIGSRNGPGQFFSGSIDELRVWDIAKTQSEIQASMNTGLAGTEANLVRYYSFEDGTGSTAITELVSGQQLALVNMESNSDWVAGAAGVSGAGGNTVTLTVTDPSGNVSTATANVTVEDNIAPSVTLNGSATVQHDAFTAYTDAGATTSDNCSATLATTDDVNVNVSGSYTVTYTATDASGNETVATRTVIVRDVTVPIAIAQDITVSLDANGNATITPEQINNGSSDDSGNVTLSIDQTDFDCNDIGSGSSAGEHSLTFLVNGSRLERSHSNAINGGSTFTMEAWVNPTGNGNDGMIINKENEYEMARFNNGFVYYAFFNQNPGWQWINTGIYLPFNEWNHVSITFNNGQIRAYKNGVLSHSLNGTGAMAANGQVLTVGARPGGQEFMGYIDEVRIWNIARSEQDIQSDYSSALSGNESGLALYYPIEEGSGTVVNDLTSNGLNGNIIGLQWNNIPAPIQGSGNEVTLTVTDPSGNVSTATANVTVIDEILPEISAPANISVFATSAAGAVVNYTTPVGTDNCTVTTALTAGLADGATFPIGTTVVTYTATDGSGNTASASFNVEVAGLAPEIIVPANITVSNDAGVCGAIVNYAATETTAIPSSTITYDIQPGSFFAVGTTTVTATAVNPVGTSVKSFTVTVNDTEAPIVITQDFTVDLDVNGNASITVADINAGSGDNCGVANIQLDKTSFTCSNVGANTVTLTVTDIHGNIASETATVTVHDDIAAVVITQNIDVYLDASGNTSITTFDIDNGSNDACGIASQSLDITTFNCTNIGANTVVLTVTDNNGNVSSNPATVTVHDDIAAVVITQNIDVYLDASGNTSITTFDIDNGSNDACGIASQSLDITAFDCSDIGANTVVLTVTDNNGNVSSNPATVTVHDDIAAVVITQNIDVYLDASGNTSITTFDIDNGSNDACGIASQSLDITTFDCTNIGANTVVLTVTDNNGNVSSNPATVTVHDDIAAVVITQNIDVYLDASGNTSITTFDIDNGSNDACGIASQSLDITTFDCTNIGANTVVLTVTDNNDNVSSNTAVVTVHDDIAAVVITQNIDIYLDATGNTSITTFDIDNGSNDACGIASQSLDITTFDCSDIGANTVVLTVTDNNGNVSSNTAVVTVHDDIAAVVITQNIDVYLDASGNTSITTFDIDNGSNDACGIQSLALDITAFDCSDIGANTVVLTVTDNNGNVSSNPAVVTVHDVIAAVVITQNIDVYLDASGNTSITTFDIDNGSNDACGIASQSLDITSFDCTNTGANTVVLTVTDVNGNVSSNTAVVTVIDVIAPTVLTQNIEVFLDENGAASITTSSVDNGSYDNCTFTLSLDNTSFTCDNVGANTVTLTSVDASGNTTSATAVVTVTDAILPTVLPTNINVYLDESGNTSIVVADVDGGTYDNCGVDTITIDIDSFDCADLGANNVTMTATDVNGNVNTGVAVVTVIDNIAPTVGAQDITVSLDENGVASIVPTDVLLFTAEDVRRDTECDLTSASDHYVLKTKSGDDHDDDDDDDDDDDNDKGGKYGKDDKGKSSKSKGDDKDDDDDDKGDKYSKYDFSGGNLLRRLDGSLLLTGTLSAQGDATNSYAVSIELIGGYDYTTWTSMDGKVKEVKYETYHLDWNYYTIQSGSLTGTGSNVGTNYPVSAYKEGEGFQLGTGANGENLTEGIRGKFDSDLGKGELRLDVSNCELLPIPAGTTYTSDNCSIVDYSFDRDTFGCDDYPTTVVNLTATDQSGNSTTVPVTVTVVDRIAPTAIALEYITVSLGANGSVTIDPSQLDGGSYDNTDCITLSIDRDTFDCEDIDKGSSFYIYDEEESCKYHKHTHGKGHNYDDDDDSNDPGKGKAYGHKKSKKTKLKGQRVTLTVTDAAGNSDQVETYVVVTDDLGPVIQSGPLTVVVYDETYGSGKKAKTKKNTEYVKDADIEPLVSDNCEVYKIDFPKTKYSSDDAGMNQLMVTAKDKSGNVTVGAVNVEVIDITSLGKYVDMCYKGKAVRIKNSSVQDYLRKGATMGSCNTMAMESSEFSFGEPTFITELNLEAYPNPTDGATMIRISSNIEGPARVGLVTTSGIEIEEIYSGVLSANEQFEVAFDGSSLPSGVYIVRMVSAGQVKNLKLMIKK